VDIETERVYPDTFNRNVSGCAYTATLNDANGDVSVIKPPPNSRSSYRLALAPGISEDRPFHLLANC
jgi:hypothetical protein